MTGITLICMGAGNVKVLKETFKSASTVCDEIVYGDMLLFPEDREILHSYACEFNLKVVRLQFDYIFRNGFASLLNILAGVAKNNHVLYLNTSEVIEEDYGILDTVTKQTHCNAFFFVHKTDPHRWYRLYDKRDLQWSGKIHEQLAGEYYPYHKPVFMMKDLPKDMDDPFKAAVFDTVKEIVYFKNYMEIVDNPETLGETDPSWIKFATDCYASFKERLLAKGDAHTAFLDGDLQRLMNYVRHDPGFNRQKFESSVAIEYQNDKKFLL